MGTNTCVGLGLYVCGMASKIKINVNYNFKKKIKEYNDENPGDEKLKLHHIVLLSVLFCFFVHFIHLIPMKPDILGIHNNFHHHHLL